MSFTVYHRPTTAPPGPAQNVLHDVAAVAVCYSRGGAGQTDALVLNDHASELLDVIGDPLAQRGRELPPVDEVELLFDPVTVEVGIRPWRIGRPVNTLHRVEACRWNRVVGHDTGDEAWTAGMRRAWPRKIVAQQFMACYGVPEVLLARPATVRLADNMLVVSTRKLVAR